MEEDVTESTQVDNPESSVEVTEEPSGSNSFFVGNGP